MKLNSTFAMFEAASQPFQLQTMEVPALAAGELLVEITFTSLCRSDILTYEGKRKEKSPTILGHEIVGIISAFGPDAPVEDLNKQPLYIGDRITWAIYASNPASKYAKKGIPQKAEDLFKYGHEQITTSSHMHGGLSEYIILRKNTPIIRIQPHVSDAVASLINCSVATVAGSLRIAGDVSGKTVLVNGTGMLGTIACAMAKTYGASKVIAVDVLNERAQQTLQWGADFAIGVADFGGDVSLAMAQLPLPNNSVDIVLEYSGQPASMEATLNILDIGGTAIWVGATFPQRDVVINAEKMVRRLLTIKGLHNYNEKDLQKAVAFIEAQCQVFPFEKMIAAVFSLEQTNEAFRYVTAHNPYRVGIQMNNK